MCAPVRLEPAQQVRVPGPWGEQLSRSTERVRRLADHEAAKLRLSELRAMRTAMMAEAKAVELAQERTEQFAAGAHAGAALRRRVKDAANDPHRPPLRYEQRSGTRAAGSRPLPGVESGSSDTSCQACGMEHPGERVYAPETTDERVCYSCGHPHDRTK